MSNLGDILDEAIKRHKSTGRKLALCKAYSWSTKARGHVEVEPVWREVYMLNGKWEMWCGKEGTFSTETPDIIRFADVPT